MKKIMLIILIILFLFIGIDFGIGYAKKSNYLKNQDVMKVSYDYDPSNLEILVNKYDYITIVNNVEIKETMYAKSKINCDFIGLIKYNYSYPLTIYDLDVYENIKGNLNTGKNSFMQSGGKTYEGNLLFPNDSAYLSNKNYYILFTNKVNNYNYFVDHYEVYNMKDKIDKELVNKIIKLMSK